MADHLEMEQYDYMNTHPELVQSLLKRMPQPETLSDLAELFKLFGDPTRIRILYSLFEEALCVCDIAKLLNITQSAISHQLKLLKQSKLIKSLREGQTVFYSLSDIHVNTILGNATEHITES